MPADADFEWIENASWPFRSHSFYENQIALTDEMFVGAGSDPHPALTNIAPTKYRNFGHEAFHVIQRKFMGEEFAIWASLVDPRRAFGDIYRFDETISDPDKMLQQFLDAGIEGQATMFGEAVNLNEMLKRAEAAGVPEDIADAEREFAPYRKVLDFVRDLRVTEPETIHEWGNKGGFWLTPSSEVRWGWGSE